MERSKPNMNLRRVTIVALVLALGVPTVFSFLPGCEKTPSEPAYDNPFDPLGLDGGGILDLLGVLFGGFVMFGGFNAGS